MKTITIQFEEGVSASMTVMDGTTLEYQATFDLVEDAELEEYAQALIDHIGGGGIKHK